MGLNSTKQPTSSVWEINYIDNETMKKKITIARCNCFACLPLEVEVPNIQVSMFKPMTLLLENIFV